MDRNEKRHGISVERQLANQTMGRIRLNLDAISPQTELTNVFKNIQQQFDALNANDQRLLLQDPDLRLKLEQNYFLVPLLERMKTGGLREWLQTQTGRRREQATDLLPASLERKLHASVKTGILVLTDEELLNLYLDPSLSAESKKSDALRLFLSEPPKVGMNIEKNRKQWEESSVVLMQKMLRAERSGKKDGGWKSLDRESKKIFLELYPYNVASINDLVQLFKQTDSQDDDIQRGILEKMRQCARLSVRNIPDQQSLFLLETEKPIWEAVKLKTTAVSEETPMLARPYRADGKQVMVDRRTALVHFVEDVDNKNPIYQPPRSEDGILYQSRMEAEIRSATGDRLIYFISRMPKEIKMGPMTLSSCFDTLFTLDLLNNPNNSFTRAYRYPFLRRIEVEQAIGSETKTFFKEYLRRKQVQLQESKDAVSRQRGQSFLEDVKRL